INNDSLFLTGDTLISITATATDISTMYAYYHVKFFKSNMQGKCDSLYFSYEDSIIRMFVEPVIWSESNQLSGDTIFIFMKEEKLDRFEMFENGFMTNHIKKNYFNQVKGKHIYGYFVNDNLDSMFVDSNAESIYYVEDAQKALLGANRVVSSTMNIYMKDEEVDKIVCHTEPDATFHPAQKINPKDFLLRNFKWLP